MQVKIHISSVNCGLDMPPSSGPLRPCPIVIFDEVYRFQAAQVSNSPFSSPPSDILFASCPLLLGLSPHLCKTEVIGKELRMLCLPFLLQLYFWLGGFRYVD